MGVDEFFDLVFDHGEGGVESLVPLDDGLDALGGELLWLDD